MICKYHDLSRRIDEQKASLEERQHRIRSVTAQQREPERQVRFPLLF